MFLDDIEYQSTQLHKDDRGPSDHTIDWISTVHRSHEWVDGNAVIRLVLRFSSSTSAGRRSGLEG